jgi:hypothetical protein
MHTTVTRIALAVLMLAATTAMRAGTPPSSMNEIAEAYVKLVLAMGPLDRDYVDAYYGPPEWRTAAESQKLSLAEIRSQAQALVAALGHVAPTAGDEMLTLRREYLDEQLQSLASRAALVSGSMLRFDEESKALYGAVAPTHDEAYFRQSLAELDKALPGPGPLLDRYAAFRDRFIVPKDKLAAVFSAAIDECRKRTRAHVELPAGESFEIEYVTGKSWGAYNWYKGNAHSLIQVNTDLPATIDRAVDLACHEGYPGHHVYNVLLEKTLVRDRGFVEYQVYPLFSPQSLIAEGSANFGIEVAFPGDERLTFERDVLYPLAGLDPRQAAAFHHVQDLLMRLDYAGNEAARRYLDGKSDKPATLAWLQTFTLRTPERAEKQLSFIEQYRSYVINYNLGRDLVRAWVEGRGGTTDHPEKRWAVFKELLTSPRLAGGLR